MDVDFHPRQKDTFVVPRPVININVCGAYCLILYEGLLQIYSLLDPKRFTLVQELPVNNVRGITSDRPFVYSRDALYYLYEKPYETRIKDLLERCRVDEARNLLVQNIGEN